MESVELGCSLSFHRHHPSRVIVVTLATGGSRIKSVGVQSCGIHQGRDRELVSNHPQCGGRMDKRRLWQRDFSWKGSRKKVLTDGLFEPKPVGRCLITTLGCQQAGQVCFQKRLRHVHFGNRRPRQVLWLNNKDNPRAGSQLAALRMDAQAQNVLAVPKELSEAEDELLGLCEKGQLDLALDGLFRMDQEGTAPSVNMYTRLLKACTQRRALNQAKRVYTHLVKRGLSSGFLGEYVVITFVKCGGLDDALQVFHELPERSVFSWTAVISGYATSGQGQEALKLYQRMQEEGVKPNTYTFVTLLKACGTIADLDVARSIHADVLKYKCESNLFVGNCLVDMYGRCGSIVDAQKVFDSMSRRDVVSWTAMLVACSQQGQPEIALHLYREMLEQGVKPDARAFVSVLQASAMLAEKEEAFLIDGLSTKAKSLHMGKALHFEAQRRGYDSDVFVGNSLVSMYGKCGSIIDARNVFDVLFQRDVVSWNAILAAYVEQGQSQKALQLYEQMREEGVSPNDWTFSTALQACAMFAEKDQECVVDGQSLKVMSLENGKIIHCDAQRKGYNSDVIIGSTLVSMYWKCGSLVDAQNVFDGLSHRDVVAWSGMIAAYVEKGQADKSLWLYERMREEGASPNAWTFVTALQACGMLAGAEQDVATDGKALKFKAAGKGKSLHAEAQRAGCDSDRFVGNTLISMYGKCGSILDAQNIFDGLADRDVVSWNAMFVAYLEQGLAEKALLLYERMLKEGVSPNDWTFVSALHACGMAAEKEDDVTLDGQCVKAKCLKKGKAIHADVQTSGYDSDVFVGNTLISVYAKSGSLVDARAVFDGLCVRDVVSWNVMLAAYVEHSQGENAFLLYQKMQEDGVSPDEITTVRLLQACSDTGSFSVLHQINESLVLAGDNLSPFLASALISAYGRCGSMLDAQLVFDTLPQPDVVSWTALIAGYSRQGDGTASLQCYEKMLLAGVQPNGVTFLSVLAACSHAGLVEKGVEYFESMSRDYGMTPEIEHYVSMVDLLGRAGSFARIEVLLSTMPMQANLALWLCLLAACRKHGEIALAERAFDGAVQLNPNHTASYILMANIYADAGFSRGVKKVKKMRKQGRAMPEGHEMESRPPFVGAKQF